MVTTIHRLLWLLCRALYLRPDKVTEGNNRDELMKCAQKTIEEYYVAPPGEYLVVSMCYFSNEPLHPTFSQSVKPGKN